MKVKEYVTIVQGIPQVFDAAINEQLQEGWQLYGNPYVTTIRGQLNYCQAMVLPKQPTIPTEFDDNEGFDYEDM